MELKPVQDAYETLFNEWLKGWDNWFAVFTKSPSFLAASGKAMGAGFNAKAKWTELIEGVLREARVASKDDVERLGASVHELEGKVNEILLQLRENPVRKEAPKKGGK